MKRFLAACAVLALSTAAMAYDITTSFQGTVEVTSNWVNFADLDTDAANCNDWYTFTTRYNAYLVLCYNTIQCPVCPFGIDEAYLWLVDKRFKQVFYASLEDGGISEIAGFCFGNGNVGVSLKTFLPYPDLEGLSGYTYVTSPEITFVLAGTRSKVSSQALSSILTLTGGVAFFDVTATDTAASELECLDGSEALFATASFRRNTPKITPDPYCPECTSDCENIYAATLETVYRVAKPSRYDWWKIYGEDDVQPYSDNGTPTQKTWDLDATVDLGGAFAVTAGADIQTSGSTFTATVTTYTIGGAAERHTIPLSGTILAGVYTITDQPINVIAGEQITIKKLEFTITGGNTLTGSGNITVILDGSPTEIPGTVQVSGTKP